MDHTLPPEIDDLRLRIRAFVAERIMPLEADAAVYDAHENIAPAVLDGLRAAAREAGLWTLHMPKARGGQGLGMVGLAACYEEMNRSIFGPVAFNAAAPDDGNMLLLDRVGGEAQKDRWLQPIIDGTVRSSFVMTEPAPGSGSDPGMMLTTAERRGDRWVINGRKWFITGAGAAKHFILIARTSDDPRKGLTAFLFDADQPGWGLVRRIPIMGPEEHGGHCERRFAGLEIADEDRLMAVGDGLKATQIRLGSARLTHCMRWLGMAKRAVEIALAYVADTLHKAVDTAIQLCGARGYSKDTPLEWMYRYARQARLVDGASEVHKMVLARRLMDEGLDFWAWGRGRALSASTERSTSTSPSQLRAGQTRKVADGGELESKRPHADEEEPIRI